MKAVFSFFIFIFIGLLSFSQVAPDKYWVIFTDKDNSPYSIDNPSEFLSSKALDRRNNQGILITEQDLPVNPSYIEGVAATGVTILNVSKWFNSVTIYTDDEQALDDIEALSYVESIEINYDKSSLSMPSGDISKSFFENEYEGPIDDGIMKKSGQSYDYGLAYNQISMLNGDALHDQGYDGEGMTIAVLDAGFINVDINSAFDSLWANNQILGVRDFVSPYNPDIYGSHTHGAKVLSTMGANWPGNIVGTAPKANYWLLRTEDGDSEYLIEELNWVAGAEYADSVGADIINSSLGYVDYHFPFEDQSYTYEDLDGNTAPVTIGADIAVSKGMIVCNSAGNEGTDPWYYINTPSDGFNVFTIGAVNSEGESASFSSHGPTADGRMKPNVVAQGQSVTVVNAYTGELSSGSGTSYSSPITAGMVACLWQANPSKSNYELMDAIQQSASNYNDPNNEIGYGIPDYFNANNILTVIDHKIGSNTFYKIYPNPFSTEFLISGIDGNIEIGTVEILDITGKIVFRQENKFRSEYSLRIGGLEELSIGFYFVKIYANNRVYTQKIIKRY